MQIVITDNTVTYETANDTRESIGVNIGDVFDVLDSCNGGWWIKAGRYTTAPNHDASTDDSEGGCRE